MIREIEISQDLKEILAGISYVVIITLFLGAGTGSKHVDILITFIISAFWFIMFIFEKPEFPMEYKCKKKSILEHVREEP